MEVDAIRITSLERTADGRALSLDGRVPGAPHAAFASSSTKHGTSGAGPRADVRSSSSLPLLVEGRDEIPTTCSTCGGGMLDRQEPLGGHMVGGVWCSTCSEQLCWLMRPLRALPKDLPFPSRRPSSWVASDIPRQRVRSGRFARLDGCGVLCLEEYGHDARTHELYGWDRAWTDMAARRSGRVETGSLVVDYDLDRVTVGGAEVGLSELERALVMLLADRLGATIRYDVVIAVVWGAAVLAESTDSYERHHLRVLTSRVRLRLGAAADLVETIANCGLRLRAEPPTGQEEPRP